MTVLLVARDLETGGAQRQALLATRALAARGVESRVAVFYGGGPLQKDADRAGVEVTDLEKTGRWDVWGPARRLLELLRREHPHVLVGYQRLPNVAGALLSPWLGRTGLVWGVRDSGTRPGQHDRVHAALTGAQHLLRSVPARIVFNSVAGRDHYVSEHGYPGDRTAVVPNGVDTDRFRPDPEAGERVRERWDVTEGALLVGLVGRLHPKKGHGDLLEAVARLDAAAHRLRLAFVGRNYGTGRRRRLRERARALGIGGRLILASARTDMRAVYSALDACVLASRWGEGWPNVVGEAMSCATPCVVTDVGDAARIVGETGLVVPPERPPRLAEALGRVAALGGEGRRDLGRAGRSRVVERYGLDRLGERWEAVLREVGGAE